MAWRDETDHTLQIIPTQHAKAADCIGCFDLTVCCAAFDLSEGKAVCSREFAEHLFERRLVLHRPSCPFDTLKRVARFLQRGFRIDPSELRSLRLLAEGDVVAHHNVVKRPYEVKTAPE